MKNNAVVLILPENALASPENAEGTSQTSYEPGLGQLVFGNAHGEFDLGTNTRYASDGLYRISEALASRSPDAQAHGILGGAFGYGQDFKNGTFEMHPYWWGDCTCGFDEKDATWSEMYPHAASCFFNQYHLEDDRLDSAGVSFDERSNLMTKWAKTNGYADAPRGMAVYCDCGLGQEYEKWRKSNDHAPDCKEVLPNFRCDNLEIRWYKYIGRGMSVNREVSRKELREIFEN